MPLSVHDVRAHHLSNANTKIGQGLLFCGLCALLIDIVQHVLLAVVNGAGRAFQFVRPYHAGIQLFQRGQGGAAVQALVPEAVLNDCRVCNSCGDHGVDAVVDFFDFRFRLFGERFGVIYLLPIFHIVRVVHLHLE